MFLVAKNSLTILMKYLRWKQINVPSGQKQPDNFGEIFMVKKKLKEKC